MKDTALNELMRECASHITEKTQEIYNLVPGVGNVDSKVMVITTCPNAKEERTGIYFDGATGKHYDGFLKQFEMTQEDVYTTYAVKYRPYKVSGKSGRIVNRDLTSEEIKMFYNFLVAEIEIIRPKVIVTMGDLAYSAVHAMEQQEAPTYGVIMPLKLNERLYELLPEPHPSDHGFSKIKLSQEVIEDLNHYNNESLVEAYVPEVKAETVVASPKPLARGPEIRYYDEMPRPKPKRKKNQRTGKHQVVLICGGSHLANDPSFTVAEEVSSVLTELNVGITRIDLYKNRDCLEGFLKALAEAEGVILATTVEWFGIGGLMQTFLDNAYMSGRFDLFEGVYLFNIAISRHGFEREASSHILKSWEFLGGIEGVNIAASIESSADIETSKELLYGIEKKAEDFYRIMNQQRIAFPTSIHNNKVVLKVPSQVAADQGEQMVMKQVMSTESKDEAFDNQMSFIPNYDAFIEKQQKDIKDIASLFKEKLTSGGNHGVKSLPERFEYSYKPDKSFGDCAISWVITDKNGKDFVTVFKGGKLTTSKGRNTNADVVISVIHETMVKITEGKLTVQRAFMTGELKAKGNFTLLYKLDGLFAF